MAKRSEEDRARADSVAAPDEVDRIVADWHRERPDLDARPLEVFSRITRLARHLDRARRAAFAAHDLDTWEFDVLSALRRAGPPYELSPGALVTATLVTSGTMTNRIDRLQARGLVERRRGSDDRRAVAVRLTARGRATTDAALAGLIAGEAEMLAGLDPERQGKLAELLRVLVGPFEGA
jgi:DNA-binding MarR family transcriptional regulator